MWRFKIAALSIFAVAATFAAVSMILAAVSMSRVAGAQRDITSLQDAGLGFSESIHRASVALGAMERNLRLLEISAAPLRWAGPLVTFVPYYGGTFSQASDIAKYGRALASSAQEFAATADSISTQTDLRRRLEFAQEVLSQPEGAGARAERKVQEAAATRQRIDSSRLTPAASALLEDADRVHEVLTALASSRAVLVSAISAALALGDAMDPESTGVDGRAQHAASALEGLAKNLEDMAARADVISRGLVAAGVLALQDLPPEVADVEWTRSVLTTSGELVQHSADLLRSVDRGLPREEGSARRLESALSGVATEGRALLTLMPTLPDEHSARPIIGEVARLLSLGETGAGHALEIMGFRGERTHLVLGQDENEVRPGGGFIGAVVEVTVLRGMITSTRFMDSYDVDRNVPIKLWRSAAQSFLTATGSPVMPFRDQNWDAAFSQSANNIRTAYLTATNTLPYVVVAVNRPAIARIVDALGGVRTSDTGDLLDGEDVRNILLASGPPAETSIGKWRTESRKSAAEVSEAVLDRLADGSSVNPAALLRALMDSAMAGDLVVSATDVQGKSLYQLLGIDGAVPALTGAAFYWVEGNAYSDKISRAVDRVLEQQIQPGKDGSAEIRLTVRYSNRAHGQGPCVQPSLAPNPPCYWALVRLYLPEESENVRPGPLPTATGSLASVRMGSAPKTVAMDTVPIGQGRRAMEVTAFLSVPPDGTIQWTVDYQLPPGSLNAAAGPFWEPSLQPGLAPVRIKVRTLPIAALCGTSQAKVFETTHLRMPDAPIQVFYETIDGCPS